MLYDNMYMGGVLVHGERSHKYIDKIRTKAGKWRYIYKNTLNYKRNKSILDRLNSLHTNENVNGERNASFDSKKVYNNLRSNMSQAGRDINKYKNLLGTYAKKGFDNYLNYANKNDNYINNIKNGKTYDEQRYWATMALKNQADFDTKSRNAVKREAQINERINKKKQEHKQDKDRARLVKSEQKILKTENKISNKKRKEYRDAVENSVQGKIKKAIERLTKRKKKSTKNATKVKPIEVKPIEVKPIVDTWENNKKVKRWK